MRNIITLISRPFPLGTYARSVRAHSHTHSQTSETSVDTHCCDRACVRVSLPDTRSQLLAGEFTHARRTARLVPAGRVHAGHAVGGVARHLIANIPRSFALCDFHSGLHRRSRSRRQWSRTKRPPCAPPFTFTLAHTFMDLACLRPYYGCLCLYTRHVCVCARVCSLM